MTNHENILKNDEIERSLMSEASDGQVSEIANTSEQEVSAGFGVTRRTILAAGTAGLAGVALAACSSGGGSANSNTSGEDSGGSAKAAGTLITPTSDVPVGGAKLAKAGGTTWLVAQPTAGTFVCHSGICTHQGCPLTQVVNDEGVCPCHGSRFNANDGAVTRGPATKPLPKQSVTVAGANIVLA